ncbi:MAG: DUF4960 domain-containing protein [Bacteroidales bacterium]|nr:DUF4960 domain-containing protein [Bacteroidales bacterium]
MKRLIYILAIGSLVLTAGCQDRDYDCADMILSAPSSENINGTLSGDDYTITWIPAAGLKTLVTYYTDGTLSGSEVVDGNTFTIKNVPTNVNYEIVLKLTDGTNFSKGVVTSFKREGASMVSGISMAQLEKDGGYDARVEWTMPEDADKVHFTATNGEKTITETFTGSTTSYIIPDVLSGENWQVTFVAENGKGKSLSSSSSLKIGKTAIGFLSVYSSADELISLGDDDEASAWLWLHETYPTAQFVSFADIKTVNDIDNFRVLFWLRDLEGVGEDAVWNMPEVVNSATPVITDWYKNGGSLLLWSHATVYVGHLGRLNIDDMKSNDKAIGTGEGGINNDVWKMAVALNPGGKFSKDNSSHPIFKGLATESTDRTKLIAFKGAGWTEDHNCLFFNLPSLLTGKGNQDEDCYNILTATYGIYPLGTWDGQIDWVSQLNVFELQQGNTDYKGTVICIGNGGCEFSMKNADGTPDKSSHPKNNSCQDNVLILAKNSLEYLKTR